MSQTKDSTADSTGHDAETQRDGGPEVTPLFGAPEGRPEQAPSETDGGRATQDRPVDEQVQRIRLDLLARETERLDRRLKQLLDQQMEDRRQREDLQGELANLCQRVDKLLSMKESREGGGGDAGSDLRDTVKPLLQAVLQMLDDPEQKSPPAGGSLAPTQARQAPQPTTNTAASGQTKTKAGQPVPAPQVVTAKYPHPSPSPARPAGPAATPSTPAPKPQGQPGASEADHVEAKAAALQKALSRLDLAAKSAARARVTQPDEGSGPNFATPRQAAAPPSSAPNATAGGDREPKRTTFEVPPSARQAAPGHGLEKASPSAGPNSLDDEDDSLSVEDPTIEIARLLRPVNAKAEARPPGRRTEPAARPPERPSAGELGPLQLGTSETPELVERPAARLDRLQSADRPIERPAARQPSSKPDDVPPTPVARTPERPSPAAAEAQDRRAAAPAQPADTDSASQERAPLSGLESPCEALPRCLTEPWDDGESGRWRPGRDKSPRRWPFRRNRSADEATESPANSGPASDSRKPTK